MNEALKVIKVKKDSEGHVTDVMLENGHVVPINHAILIAKNGKLDDISVVRGKDGGEFLRGDPHGEHNDDLNKLPTFK